MPMESSMYNKITDQQLCQRALQLAGCSLGEIAQEVDFALPHHTQSHKGVIGNLIEVFLGAEAGSKPGPDFPELGIELKTIPIDRKGKPLESTFVCVAPLQHIHALNWRESNVYKKLARVLWLPIEGEAEIPVHERRIGHYLLWSPNQREEAILRQDWEEHMELIVMGQVESITANQGEVLQVRPKAANNKATTNAIGPDGTLIKTLPRGFYLRSHFTHSILQRYFV